MSSSDTQTLVPEDHLNNEDLQDTGDLVHGHPQVLPRELPCHLRQLRKLLNDDLTFFCLNRIRIFLIGYLILHTARHCAGVR